MRFSQRDKKIYWFAVYKHDTLLYTQTRCDVFNVCAVQYIPSGQNGIQFILSKDFIG